MLEDNPVENNVNGDMYDIYNNRTQSEFCNTVKDVIKKEHLHPLLNKCKF